MATFIADLPVRIVIGFSFTPIPSVQGGFFNPLFWTVVRPRSEFWAELLMKTKTTALWLVISVLVSPAVISAAEDSQSSAPNKEEKASEAATQLENAKRVLAEMRTKYRNDHPRVQEQLRKVAELERELAPKNEEKASKAAARLENAERVLAEMRIKYPNEHPLVKEQLRKVAELKRGLAPDK